jgi:hypothetical protein
VDGLENVEMSEEAAEKDRSSFGHADKPGVGDGNGDGEESLVVVGDAVMVFSGARKGL